MIFLPIVVRELRVAARRKSTYRARFWTAFAAIAFGSYLVFVSGAFPWGRPQGGMMVFNSLAWLCFLSCLSLATNTVDCISEEKREGTLGFLFLTDLKGHDIALGKLFSSSLISFYSLLGILPIVAVSLLFGGVTATEFWAVALALLNVFFFSQAAGILVSAFSRKRNRATFAAGMILLGYTIGFYLLSVALSYWHFNRLASQLECLNLSYCIHWACTMARIRPGHLPASLDTIGVRYYSFISMRGCSWPSPVGGFPKAGRKKRLRRKFLGRNNFCGSLMNGAHRAQQCLIAIPFFGCPSETG